MKNLLGICAALLSLSTMALKLDYSAETLVRSYSPGLYIKGNFGASQRFYGGEGKLLYGHIRPEVEFKTSGSINTAAGKLELYPISFLGFYTGYSYSSRENDDLPTFDCKVVVCRSSEMVRQFWGVKTALAFGGVYFLFDQNFYSSTPKDKPGRVYAEELATLLASPGKDVLSQTTGLLGYNLNKELSFGVLGKYNSMRNYANRSSMLIAFGRKTGKKWSFMAGPGVFNTRQKTTHATVLAILKYTGAKGNLLF